MERIDARCSTGTKGDGASGAKLGIVFTAYRHLPGGADAGVLLQQRLLLLGEVRVHCITGLP